jgi:hypothetical protein
MQEAPKNILKHERAEISDVREIVDGRSAGVNSYFARMQRLKRFKTAGKRVVKAYIVHFGNVHKGVIVADAPNCGKREIAAVVTELPALAFVGNSLQAMPRSI